MSESFLCKKIPCSGIHGNLQCVLAFENNPHCGSIVKKSVLFLHSRTEFIKIYLDTKLFRHDKSRSGDSPVTHHLYSSITVTAEAVSDTAAAVVTLISSNTDTADNTVAMETSTDDIISYSAHDIISLGTHDIISPSAHDIISYGADVTADRAAITEAAVCSVGEYADSLSNHILTQSITQLVNSTATTTQYYSQRLTTGML